MAENSGFNPFNIFGKQPAHQVSGQPDPNSNAGDPNASKNPQNPNPNNGGMDLNNPGADPANKTSGGANDPNKNKGPTSPLDDFKDMFKVDPNKKAAADPFSEKLFTLDPQKLAAGTAKLDFTRNLNPELVGKALQGDSQAFSQVLNQAIQGSFSMAVQAITGMVENGISRNNERFNSVLEGRFRDFSIDSTESNNPALKHPAAKPVLAAIKKHIAAQDTSLSAADVNKRAEEYFLAMGSAMTSIQTDGQNKDKTKPGSGSDVDWENLFLNTQAPSQS